MSSFRGWNWPRKVLSSQFSQWWSMGWVNNNTWSTPAPTKFGIYVISHHTRWSLYHFTASITARIPDRGTIFKIILLPSWVFDLKLIIYYDVLRYNQMYKQITKSETPESPSSYSFWPTGSGFDSGCFWFCSPFHPSFLYRLSLPNIRVFGTRASHVLEMIQADE